MRYIKIVPFGFPVRLTFVVILALLTTVVTPPAQACGTVVSKAFLPEIRGEVGLPPQDERGRGCYFGKDLIFRLLVPEKQTGQTLEAKPVLYWFVSQPVDAKLVFTVAEYLPPGSREAGEVLVYDEEFERTVKTAGIYPLSIADFLVTLTPEVEYEMTLSLRCDNPKSPASEMTVDGTIKRVNRTIALKTCIRQHANSPSGLYETYKNNYVWYDALHTISTISDSRTRRQLLKSFLVESRATDEQFKYALQSFLKQTESPFIKDETR